MTREAKLTIGLPALILGAIRGKGKHSRLPFFRRNPVQSTNLGFQSRQSAPIPATPDAIFVGMFVQGRAKLPLSREVGTRNDSTARRKCRPIRLLEKSATVAIRQRFGLSCTIPRIIPADDGLSFSGCPSNFANLRQFRLVLIPESQKTAVDVSSRILVFGFRVPLAEALAVHVFGSQPT